MNSGRSCALNQADPSGDEQASRNTGDDGREGPQESVMATARNRVHTDKATGLTGDFAELMRALRELVDPYRPEEHYMRGPGPKWHAKHERTAEADEVPALVHAEG